MRRWIAGRRVRATVAVAAVVLASAMSAGAAPAEADTCHDAEGVAIMEPAVGLVGFGGTCSVRVLCAWDACKYSVRGSFDGAGLVTGKVFFPVSGSDHAGTEQCTGVNECTVVATATLPGGSDADFGCFNQGPTAAVASRLTCEVTDVTFGG